MQPLVPPAEFIVLFQPPANLSRRQNPASGWGRERGEEGAVVPTWGLRGLQLSCLRGLRPSLSSCSPTVSHSIQLSLHSRLSGGKDFQNVLVRSLTLQSEREGDLYKPQGSGGAGCGCRHSDRKHRPRSGQFTGEETEAQTGNGTSTTSTCSEGRKIMKTLLVGRRAEEKGFSVPPSVVLGGKARKE